MFACLFVAVVACQPVAGQDIVAHRGASHDAPENTLAAFRLAWQLGADAVEGDFYVTKDQQIVCIHDADTERTAGVSLRVADATWEQLRQLDVGRWKGEQFAGERIPTLQQVLETVPAGKSIFIEIKCGPEIVPLLEPVLKASGLRQEQLVIIAFDKQVVKVCKQQLPWVKCHWLTSYKEDAGQWQPTLDSVLETLADTGADGLDTNANVNVVDTAFADRIRAAGHELHCWTVNDPRIGAQMQRVGVASITTDRPRYLRYHLPTPGLGEYLLGHLPFDGPEASDGDATGDTTGGDTSDASRQVASELYQPAVFGNGIDLAADDTAWAAPVKLPERGTICCWYHTRPWYNYQTVFDNAVDPNAWEMWIDANGMVKFRVDPQGPIVNYALHPRGDVGEWHHLAVTWDRTRQDGEAIRLFVDGHAVDSQQWNNAPRVAPGAAVYVGGGNNGNTVGNGMVDDFAIFGTVLRPADIRQVMYGGVSSITRQSPVNPVVPAR